MRQVKSVSRSTLREVELLAVLADEEEPVAAPGDVAGDRAEAGDVDRHVRWRGDSSARSRW